jgi:hypothetical protein
VLLAHGDANGTAEDPQVVHIAVHNVDRDIHRLIDRPVNSHR